MQGAGLVAAAVPLAFCMLWALGANDVANALGTSVGSHALRIQQAIVVAGIFEFLGSSLMGSHVATTLGSKVVDIGEFDSDRQYCVGMVAALGSAFIWLTIGTWFGMPLSSTHTVLGGVVGFALVAVGAGPMKWFNLGMIALSWVVSPLAGALISYVLFTFIKKVVLMSPRRVQRALVITPALFGLTIATNVVFLLKGGPPSIRVPLSGGALVGLFFGAWIAGAGLGVPVVRWFFKKYPRDSAMQHCIPPNARRSDSEGASNAKKKSHNDKSTNDSIDLTAGTNGNSQNQDALDNNPDTNNNPSKTNTNLNTDTNPNTNTGTNTLDDNHKNDNQNGDIEMAVLPNVDETADIPPKSVETEQTPHPMPNQTTEQTTEASTQPNATQTPSPTSTDSHQIITCAETEVCFVPLLVLSACAVAFAHGGNDAANAIGPLYIVLNYAKDVSLESSSGVPLYVTALGGIAIVVGLGTWGYKVMATVGTKITKLSFSKGYAAQFGASVSVLIATYIGMPISTTSVIVGSVIGVGVAEGAPVDLMIFVRIFGGWLLTLPAAAVLSIALFYALSPAYGV